MNKKRLLFIYTCFIAFVLVVCIRLYIIADNGSTAENVLSGQYSRRVDILSRPGFIFDRNGKLLDRKPSGFLTFLYPHNLDYDECCELAEKLSVHSEYEQSYLLEKMLKGKPFLIETDIKMNEPCCDSFKKYTDDNTDFLCHILGYRNSDGNGVSGLTMTYEDFLNNHSGAEVFARYESDAVGRPIEGTSVTIYDNGYGDDEGIYLTIDHDIQIFAEQIAKDDIEMGAIVIQDTKSGEILALVSTPTFEKNNVSEYLDSEKGELLNRCFLGYTPGSVFKTVVATSALSENVNLSEREYECLGKIEVGGADIRCHDAAGHGKLQLSSAFASSCNPYFIDLGCSLGIERLLTTASMFGIGKYSSVNLFPVSEGTLPSNFDVSESETAYISVGQGKILLTPLQVCSMMSTAATGVYHKPSLVKRLVTTENSAEYGADKGKTVLDKDVVAKLREMFEKCVSDGTGYRAKSNIVKCGGKTATAQSGQIKNGKEVIHRWFAGYFPADEPEFTVCILCDGNGENNENPSEIFKKIAEGLTEHNY